MSCIIENYQKVDMSKICFIENYQKVDIAKAYLIENGQAHLLWSGEPNMYVAVGYTGRKVAFSEDGINWTTQEIVMDDGATTVTWITSLCYGNGIFLMSCARYLSGNIMYNWLAYSTDGINYYSTDISYTPVNGSDPTAMAMAYGKGKFVVTVNGVSYYSTNGKDWTQLPMCVGTVKFVNNRFVTSSGKISGIKYYSFDGITWNTVTSNFTDTNFSMADITYLNGKYITAASSYQPVMFYSTDLINWTRKDPPVTYQSHYARGAETNGTIAVLVGATHSSTLETTDGFWVDANLNTGNVTGLKSAYKGYGDSNSAYYYKNIVYHDKFICGMNPMTRSSTYSATDKFAYSLDGKTWTEFTISGVYCAGLVYAGS